jgi:hypothetical protein
MGLRRCALYAGDNMGEQDHTRVSAIEFARVSAIELQRIAPLAEAARLAGVSVDTLQRHHQDKILQLSPRRLGMRVRDALSLGKRKTA